MLERYKLSGALLVAIVVTNAAVYGMCTGIAVVRFVQGGHDIAAGVWAVVALLSLVPLLYFGRALLVVAVEGAVALKKAKDAGEF